MYRPVKLRGHQIRRGAKVSVRDIYNIYAYYVQVKQLRTHRMNARHILLKEETFTRRLKRKFRPAELSESNSFLSALISHIKLSLSGAL